MDDDMQIKRRLVLFVTFTAAVVAAFIYSDIRGVPIWVINPTFVVLEVAAVSVIYRIRSPRVLGYFALLAVLGLGLGLLGGVGLDVLDHLSLWGQGLFLFALIAVGFEQRRRKRRRQG
jgi:hypothetical protein